MHILEIKLQNFANFWNYKIFICLPACLAGWQAGWLTDPVTLGSYMTWKFLHSKVITLDLQKCCFNEHLSMRHGVSFYPLLLSLDLKSLTTKLEKLANWCPCRKGVDKFITSCKVYCLCNQYNYYCSSCCLYW